MKLPINPYALVAFILALSGKAVAATSTAAPSSVPTPGQSCSGDTAFCIGDSTPIILRCESGSLQPGNCDDNLGEPPLGAICVSSASPSSALCSALESGSITTSPTSIPTPGQTCSGDTAFCDGDSSPIIFRCDNGSLQPGNCDDNLGEPPLGAVCVSYSPSSASCSVFESGSSTSSPTSVPTPGQTCSGDTAFCPGDITPIILRCESGSLQPGNCEDNLGEPPLGAVCVSFSPSSASCSALEPITTTASGTGIGGTGTSPGGPTTTAANGTFPASSLTPTTSSPPFATGAADSTRSWAGAAMVGVVAVVAGGAMVL